MIVRQEKRPLRAVFLGSEEIVGEARKAYWVMNPILPA
jgi:hypothetical protein